MFNPDKLRRDLIDQQVDIQLEIRYLEILCTDDAQRLEYLKLKHLEHKLKDNSRKIKALELLIDEERNKRRYR